MRRFVLFILPFIIACAPQKYIEKPVIMKCQIPEIPEPELEEVPENVSYPEKLKVIFNNCLKIKRENELLREALKLCK